MALKLVVGCPNRVLDFNQTASLHVLAEVEDHRHEF